jgi:hypothetical protein
MSNQTQPINTSSSSSSSLSNQAGLLQNADLNVLASQIANVLQINKICDALSNLTNQIDYLHKKVDSDFGETEKLFSSPNDPKVRDNQNTNLTLSSPSNASNFVFPKLQDKDSKNLWKKVRGQIVKDYQSRVSTSDFEEYFGELSSSSSSSRSLSAPLRKPNVEIYDDTDKQVLKDLGMDKADLFYYKMDAEFKDDLDNLIKSHSSIFEEKKLVPPIHNNNGDITGYMMQKNAQNFAALGENFLQIRS